MVRLRKEERTGNSDRAGNQAETNSTETVPSENQTEIPWLPHCHSRQQALRRYLDPPCSYAKEAPFLQLAKGNIAITINWICELSSWWRSVFSVICVQRIQQECPFLQRPSDPRPCRESDIFHELPAICFGHSDKQWASALIIIGSLFSCNDQSQ